MALSDIGNDEYIYTDDSDREDIPDGSFILSESLYSVSKVHIKYTVDKFDLKFLKYFDLDKQFEFVKLFEQIVEKLILEEKILHKKILEKFEEDRPKGADCNICFKKTGCPVIFCRGCFLPVHKLCYGIPYQVDEEDYLCTLCKDNKQFSTHCKFCNGKGGAMKILNTYRHYGHVICTHFIQSTEFSNLTFLEPIDIVYEEKSVCSICHRYFGTTMRCGTENCDVFFHTSCAFENENEVDFENHKIYCEKHGMIGHSTISVNFFKPVRTVYSYLKKNGIPMNSYILNKIIENGFYYLFDANQLPFFFNVYTYYILKMKYESKLLQTRVNMADFEKLCEFIYTVKDRPIKYLNYNRPHNQDLSYFMKKQPRIKKHIPLKDHLKNKYNANIRLFNLYNMLKSRLEGIRHNRHLTYNYFNMIYILNSCDMKSKLLILYEKMNLSEFHEFKPPISNDIAPNYNYIIQNPKCLMDIRKSIFSILNYNYDSFTQDMKLIADNCYFYNKNNEYYIEMANSFIRKYEEIKFEDIVVDRRTIEDYLKIFLFKFML